MALEVVWTDEAIEGLDEIIQYLENNWTEKEIRNFFTRIEVCLKKISNAPPDKKILLENLALRNTNTPPNHYFLHL